MRIDCHAHGDPNSCQGDPKAYVESCCKHGIEAVVLIEPIERCLEAVRKFGDFVIPVARVNMDAAGAKEVEDCIEAGCKGSSSYGRLCPTATSATGRCMKSWKN